MSFIEKIEALPSDFVEVFLLMVARLEALEKEVADLSALVTPANGA